jgi:hypothetical protein
MTSYKRKLELFVAIALVAACMVALGKWAIKSVKVKGGQSRKLDEDEEWLKLDMVGNGGEFHSRENGSE